MPGSYRGTRRYVSSPTPSGDSGTDLTDFQGRARPTLAQLYNWRYKELGDLPNVRHSPEYVRANPGFSYDYQFIDVGDMDGRGESEPVPYFYQVLHFCC